MGLKHLPAKPAPGLSIDFVRSGVVVVVGGLQRGAAGVSYTCEPLSL